MRTSVLLSIKPEFADKIFAGLKRFEFRRVLFKAPNVSRVVVYASTPIQKVIGEFEVDEILAHSKQELWKLTKAHAGIEKKFFDEYFGDRSQAYAIKIKCVRRYPRPVTLYRVCRSKRPPQSFMYLNTRWSIDSHLGVALMREIESNHRAESFRRAEAGRSVR
jgi:predicted transcriptional regulator